MRIGIDLGGSKIEGIVIDDLGVERLRRRVPTPVGDYDRTISTIRDVVIALERDVGKQASVGIGIPGSLSPESGRVRNANATWLNGRRLDHDLSAALARPVRVANDANCFAQSEALDGAAAGADIVFGVILGTGVGGGIVVRGRVLTGKNAISGEWGHNPLPWALPAESPGHECYCGRRGCIETYLSGPALSRDHQNRSGLSLTPDEIDNRAKDGCRTAKEALDVYVERLARSLASVINVLDPDAIVLGGGVSNLACLYDTVPDLLPTWVFSDHVTTRIVRNRHGDSSGVRGAAWLWPPGQSETL
jgi:fructokinase